MPNDDYRYVVVSSKPHIENKCMCNSDNILFTINIKDFSITIDNINRTYNFNNNSNIKIQTMSDYMGETDIIFTIEEESNKHTTNQITYNINYGDNNIESVKTSEYLLESSLKNKVIENSKINTLQITSDYLLYDDNNTPFEIKCINKDIVVLYNTETKNIKKVPLDTIKSYKLKQNIPYIIGNMFESIIKCKKHYNCDDNINTLVSTANEYNFIKIYDKIFEIKNDEVVIISFNNRKNSPYISLSNLSSIEESCDSKYYFNYPKGVKFILKETYINDMGIGILIEMYY